MNVPYMRDALLNLYEGKWVALNDMPDRQIIAIYHNHVRRGRFNKPSKKKKEVVLERQISIWDIMKGENKWT